MIRSVYGLIILVLLGIPFFGVAQTKTDACPDFKNKPKSKRGDFLEYLRTHQEQPRNEKYEASSTKTTAPKKMPVYGKEKSLTRHIEPEEKTVEEESENKSSFAKIRSIFPEKDEKPAGVKERKKDKVESKEETSSIAQKPVPKVESKEEEIQADKEIQEKENEKETAIASPSKPKSRKKVKEKKVRIKKNQKVKKTKRSKVDKCSSKF